LLPSRVVTEVVHVATADTVAAAAADDDDKDD